MDSKIVSFVAHFFKIAQHDVTDDDIAECAVQTIDEIRSDALDNAQQALDRLIDLPVDLVGDAKISQTRRAIIDLLYDRKVLMFRSTSRNQAKAEECEVCAERAYLIARQAGDEMLMARAKGKKKHLANLARDRAENVADEGVAGWIRHMCEFHRNKRGMHEERLDRLEERLESLKRKTVTESAAPRGRRRVRTGEPKIGQIVSFQSAVKNEAPLQKQTAST